ncbi:MAG: hypothetical protein PVH85_18215 [Desulfobacterales bacterium]
MSRYNIDEFGIEEDDWSADGESRRFGKMDADQPRRSPIRRKDKWRPEEGVKPKAKRNHRKIQQRIKNKLYEATNQEK